MRRIAVPVLLTGLLTLAATAFQLRGRVPFTSDQALSALMALDILELGVHPAFYYGAEYGGTVESHLLAIAFRLLPASVVTYRIVMGGFLAAFALVTWRSTRLAFGETAGTAAGLYVAAGPSFLLYKSLTSDGAYVSLLLASALAVYCLLAATLDGTEKRFPWRELGLLGFFAGLAFWIHLPAAFLLPVVLLGVSLNPRLRRVAPRSLAAGASGALLGASPWLASNLGRGFPSLGASEAAVASVESVPTQVIALLSEGWPILLGGSSVGRDTATFPGAEVAAMTLLAALLLAGVTTALRDSDARRRHAAAVFVATLASVSLLTLTMARSDFREPRYLICAYVGIAPLVGLLSDLAWRRGRAMGMATCAVILGLNVSSEWSAPALDHADGGRIEWGAYDLEDVIAQLESMGIRATYAPYRTAYRLAFLTDRRISSTPFGSGSDGTMRHRRSCDAVNSVPDRTLLLHGEDLSSTVRYLDARSITRDEHRVGPFTLIRNLSPALGLRFAWCSPADVAAHRFASIEVKIDGFPGEMIRGSAFDARVVIQNTSDRWLEPTTRLTYEWLSHPGNRRRHSGARHALRAAPGPGSTVTVPLTVVADLPPATYTLVVDLVVEHVIWYGHRGGRPFRSIVRIGQGSGPVIAPTL